MVNFYAKYRAGLGTVPADFGVPRPAYPAWILCACRPEPSKVRRSRTRARPWDVGLRQRLRFALSPAGKTNSLGRHIQGHPAHMHVSSANMTAFASPGLTYGLKSSGKSKPLNLSLAILRYHTRRDCLTP